MRQHACLAWRVMGLFTLLPGWRALCTLGELMKCKSAGCRLSPWQPPLKESDRSGWPSAGTRSAEQDCSCASLVHSPGPADIQIHKLTSPVLHLKARGMATTGITRSAVLFLARQIRGDHYPKILQCFRKGHLLKTPLSQRLPRTCVDVMRKAGLAYACLCTGARGLRRRGHDLYRVGIREGMAEQVFSPSPKSMIACQHGAVKALRGMLYGSRLVPVAFVSELLKFCVCSLSGVLPFVVGCQVSGSAFFVVSKVASGGKVDKGTAEW